MSTKKQKSKQRGLLLDKDARRYGRYGKRKTYVSRKGSLISIKELKRRELQRATDVGYDPVNFNKLERTKLSEELLLKACEGASMNVGALTKEPFWVRVAKNIGKLISRMFRWKVHGK